jgi:hypothetical protein
MTIIARPPNHMIAPLLSAEISSTFYAFDPYLGRSQHHIWKATIGTPLPAPNPRFADATIKGHPLLPKP